MKSPKIIIGMVILGVFVLMAIFGPVIAPHNRRRS
jgi:ABC-type dipeptide/oligopeptide/nickel transport system permease subunit